MMEKQEDGYVNIPWFAFLSYISYIYLLRTTHREIGQIRDKTHKSDMRYALAAETFVGILLSVVFPVVLTVGLSFIAVVVFHSIKAAVVCTRVMPLIGYMLGVYSCYRMHRWRQGNGFEV